VKFALDTNVFVDAFRDEAFAAGLSAFLERALPATFLSAIVMQELTAGARTREQARALEAAVFAPFERRGRVFAPSADAFRESGRLVAAVAGREGWQSVLSNPSLTNDSLLATSCRERGITLITSDRDFDRFRPWMGKWRHALPWPSLPQPVPKERR